MFRAKRLAALLAPLLVLSLAACGSDTKTEGLGDKTLSGWDAVTISGDVGTAPEVKWNGQMDTVKAGTTDETKTLVTGKGEKIKDGDKVYAYVWVGDGYSQKEAYNDYKNGNPEELTADKTLSPVFQKMLTGATLGSRVAALANATDIFGEAGNSSLGIANSDPLVIILDVTSKAVDKPTDVSPDKVPGVVSKNGKPVGLDFKGLTKPDPTTGPFLRATLKQGTGATITADDTVKVNYLGETFGAKTPFDESYSKTPAEFALSGVVKGWTYGLTGVKVGSRIVLQIPPILGYGSQAQSAIPANSTLYFVIDVISATKPSPSASPSASAGQ